MGTMRVGLITIGNELLNGFTLDRNAAWIGQQLLAAGIKVDIHHTIKDDFGEIYDTLEYQWSRWECDHIIVTGGLGPTVDDITVSAFFEYFDDSEEFDKEYWNQLKERFKKLNFKIPNLNKNQAYKSKKGIMIPNLIGSARGLHYFKSHSSGFKSAVKMFKGEQRKVHFYALPGVPKEMQSMFNNYVLPQIEKTNKHKVICRSIRTTGVPESVLQEKISDLIDNYKEICDIAFLPHRMLGVDIRITSIDNKKIEELISLIVKRIKKYVYGFDTDKLEEVIANLFIKNNLTISTAESCTAGLLGAKLTDFPGSSSYYKGGSICYSNELKISDVNVDKKLIDKFGAVSEEVAGALAEGIARKNSTDIGIGITGIAGPNGGTEKKPVGLVFVGIFYKNNLYIKRYNLTPNRNTNRELTVILCLNEIRKILKSS